jgi:hypothetical protein
VVTAPDDVLARLRRICARLPRTLEEPAWVGTRWKVRGRTFAHVLVTDGERPAAHVRAAGLDGPACVLVFRSSGTELEVLTRAGPPFFRAGWGADVVGMVLGPAVDWDEVEELLTESYCVRAPAALAARVGRPEA